MSIRTFDLDTHHKNVLNRANGITRSQYWVAWQSSVSVHVYADVWPRRDMTLRDATRRDATYRRWKNRDEASTRRGQL